MESSHEKEKYFVIGDCDLCGEDNRYVEHGKDAFGVHVIDYCAYGCNNEKSKVNTNNQGRMSLDNLIKEEQCMTDKEKAMLILETLDEHIQIDWNLEEYYLKGILLGLKKLEEKEG
ncbi:hypothetical protein [Bacillus cereus]|uniref:hypothetical protein n=1 Tax=Bacillus cereus TaxID=1396 RepID=UPI000BFBCE5F|nr:hypothetical protein [Bacillus cereus]PGV00807.1 hypothetical protein COD77_22530 [Bacillus cereus]